MQFIVKNLFRIVLLMMPYSLAAQSTYLPQGQKHQAFLERIEIKMKTNSDLNVLTPKPISRRLAVRAAEYADSINRANPGLLSKIDEYNLRSLLMNNSEWVQGD